MVFSVGCSLYRDVWVEVVRVAGKGKHSEWVGSTVQWATPAPLRYFSRTNCSTRFRQLLGWFRQNNYVDKVKVVYNLHFIFLSYFLYFFLKVYSSSTRTVAGEPRGCPGQVSRKGGVANSVIILPRKILRRLQLLHTYIDLCHESDCSSTSPSFLTKTSRQ
jgi:hypothetical protein